MRQVGLRGPQEGDLLLWSPFHPKCLPGTINSQDHCVHACLELLRALRGKEDFSGFRLDELKSLANLAKQDQTMEELKMSIA